MIGRKFSLDKILNIDIRTYVESQGKTLDQYEMKGVHSDGKRIYDFAEEVPHGTEVVVNYQFKISQAAAKGRYGDAVFNSEFIQVGTALIPKENSKD